MKGSFIFSGTGNAEGIPVPFCSCPVCSVPSGKERLRSSGILTVNDKVFLMDIGPDIRRQLLTYRIDHIDTAFLTHVHYDHVGGLDDLRAYNLVKLLPVKLILSNFSYQKLMLTKPYLFLKNEGDSFSAMFDLNILDDVLIGDGNAEGVPFRYVTYRQGPFQVNGFRFGDFAYIVDMQQYNPIIKEALKGIRTLVLT
ncbi:MAG: MBL fold metallo-hydrolase, partial [Victivallaceae bacterium]